MKGILDNLPMEELLKILERNIKSQSSIPCITPNINNDKCNKNEHFNNKLKINIYNRLFMW